MLGANVLVVERPGMRRKLQLSSVLFTWCWSSRVVVFVLMT